MLIDKIAEAIWDEHAKQSGQAASPWNEVDGATHARFSGYARAALEAISHPTPEMLAMGNRALQAWDDSEHYRSPITGIYRAMIGAELPPEPAKLPRDSFDEL